MLSLPIIDETSNGSHSTGKPLAGVFMTRSLAAEYLSPQDPSGVWPYGWQARESVPAGLGSEGGRHDRRLFPYPCRVSEGR